MKGIYSKIKKAILFVFKKILSKIKKKKSEEQEITDKILSNKEKPAAKEEAKPEAKQDQTKS